MMYKVYKRHLEGVYVTAEHRYHKIIQGSDPRDALEKHLRDQAWSGSSLVIEYTLIDDDIGTPANIYKFIVRVPGAYLIEEA